MNSKEENKSVSSIYALGFPINVALEALIQFTSLLIPAHLVIQALKTDSVIRVTLAILESLYLYPLAILLLGAMVTRFLPKPKLGYLEDEIDQLKFQLLAALNKFIRRTPASWLLIFPFPAYYFYKIAGSQIAMSAFQSSSDSIPDVYLVSIGENTLLGWNCVILGHCSPDSGTTFLGRVEIGNDVLIGESVTVWPNVKIGDGSIVQNKSVVRPGTIIPPGEIWGGIPAQKIRSLKEEKNLSVNYSSNIDDVKIYIKSFLIDHHQLENFNSNSPFLSLNLSAEQVMRLLNKIEKRYSIFIDRTQIDIEKFSFDDLITLVSPHLDN